MSEAESVRSHEEPGRARVATSPRFADVRAHIVSDASVPMGDHGHRVQFYEDGASLAATVAEFLADGLRLHQPVIVIATAPHHIAFLEDLATRGLDVEGARRRGHLTLLDAEETLSAFLIDGMPDAVRFRAAIGPVIEQSLRDGGGAIVRVYAEMMDLLWKAGRAAAAIHLEQLWNELGDRYGFSLLSAYAVGNFYKSTDAGPFRLVARQLTHARGNGPNRAEIDILEQRTRALEAEVAHREAIEVRLRAALETQIRVEQFLKEQSQLLELIASGRPLAECLSALCAAVARLNPGIRAGVVLADEARRALDLAVTPQLRASFSERLRGAPINELAIGTCGAAIHSGRPIACADIARDERWSREWRELCVAHDVLACYSAPVLDSAGVPRASFMLCFDRPHVAEVWDLRLAEFGTHITSIALERERSAQALRASEARLEAELADATLLQRTSAQLINHEDVGALYEVILDAAVEIMRSEYASMQLLYPERGQGGELRLLAFRGFSAHAASFWEWVRADSESTCGEALRTGKRVIASDVERCEFMAGTDDLATYLETGIHAVQTTPLVSRSGEILGMISTHWREPHEPSERELRMLDILVRQAADLIERRLSEERERRILEEVMVARLEAEEARARADEANRAKSDFLATMSHELRTPLNAISGYAQLMQLGVPEPAPASHQEYLSRIQQSQAHLLGLINEVLNYARIEAGRVDYDVIDLAARELLASIEPLVAPQIRAKRQTYRCEPCDAALNLCADRDKVIQILLNLVSNAVKFTAEGGQITLSADAQDELTVAIRVQDSGIGIPREKLDVIFDPFVQVDASRTRIGDGTGLGLAISRDLARGMGGDLTVESSVGAGSTFTLQLPRSRASDPRTAHRGRRYGGESSSPAGVG